MIRVGLTGGIASGKSVADHRFAQWGIPVIDYDKLARQAVGTGSPGLARLTEEFGASILRLDGALDRVKLAQLTFADPVVRQRVEAIVHPLVYALAADRDDQARRQVVAMVVHDIPLLVETAAPASFDYIIVIAAPADLRAERLVTGRGLCRTEAEARIAAQASEAERLAIADVVFDGSGTEDNLRDQVDAWLEQLGWPAEQQPAR